MTLAQLILHLLRARGPRDRAYLIRECVLAGYARSSVRRAITRLYARRADRAGAAGLVSD